MKNLNLTDPSVMGQFVFGGIDYFVFVIMLMISAAIGIYFGFFNKSANTTDEYLMGGRKMKVIPIAISLLASKLSALSIITLPGEMYIYGINYFFEVVAIIVIIPILCWIVIPIYYNNNISNCYEYLELRFNRSIRNLVTMAFLCTVFVVLPVYNFVPSLAFAQVTHLNVHLINAIVCSICVFYTMFGGIKAVVWTDVIQGGIMVMSVVIVGIMGIRRVGGISKILKIASEGGRLTPDFTLDLQTRMTFWNSLISSICARVAYIGYQQSCFQRISALATLQQAKRCLIIFGFGYLLIMFFNAFTGIIMYALYHDCDPIKAGFVEKPDKLVPYFVQDIVRNLKGMPGVFISCVFSAALSTISASMNALAGVIYMDYIKPRFKHTESRANFIMKGIVLFLGVYCILGGFIVQKFKSVLQLIFTISGITYGAIFGIFTMGMLLPKAHVKAVVLSAIVSVLTMIIIVLGARGKVTYKGLPTSTAGCSMEESAMETSKNISILQQLATTHSDDNFDLFKLSFNWYIAFGAFIVFIIGIPLSYLLKPGKHENFDVKLLSPIVQPFVKYQLTNTEEPT